MTIEHALRVDSEVIRPGTSLFKPDTGHVFWYYGIKDGSVRLEGVRQTVTLPTEPFRAPIREGDLVIESRPPGPPTGE